MNYQWIWIICAVLAFNIGFVAGADYATRKRKSNIPVKGPHDRLSHWTRR